MTRPTQAQIETAQLLEELRNPCGIQTQYTKAMYEHAAEVIEKLLAALTAAAEAEYGNHERADEMRRLFKSVANHTIERCAQVAQSYGGDGANGHIIAAAIRKLKD